MKYQGVYITAEGKAKLEREIEELTKRLRGVRKQRENMSFGARSSGNSGCGCPLPDAESEEEGRIRQRIAAIQLKLQRSRIAPIPENANTLEIGCVGTLMYRVTKNQIRTRVYENIHIVGQHEGDCDSNPRKVGYRLPEIQLFLGAHKGFVEDVMRNGKLVPVTLTNIRLAYPVPKKRIRKHA